MAEQGDYRFFEWMRWHGGLLMVLLVSLVTRVWLLRWWSPAPFGDVFNFIRIAVELARGGYYVSEKRLPFYPFLILVGHTLAPVVAWEIVAIVLAIAMSLITLVLLYAIGRTLKFRTAPSLLSR